MAHNPVLIRRALISVSDKEGLDRLSECLRRWNIRVISTGGTAARLRELGLDVTAVEEITGRPEAFGGRMKTLSYEIASALLYRREDPQDEADARKLGIAPIDLVVCNLYPFAAARDRKVSDADLIENIDIGGPTMVRAGAKNFESCTVVTSPAQYDRLFRELDAGRGATTWGFRRELALEAFAHTASYEASIANELGVRFADKPAGRRTFLVLESAGNLRYGENPHQAAALYRSVGRAGPGVATAEVLQGKALSYNNLLDADAAWKCVWDAWRAARSEPGAESVAAVIVIKHGNPCGLAAAGSELEALKSAWQGDPVSAFGGILAFTSSVSEAAATELADKFLEVIVAPDFQPEAIRIFAGKKNLRLLKVPPCPVNAQEKILRSVSGGILEQEEDEALDTDLRTVTRATFPATQTRLVRFGIVAAKYLKSNAIALVGSSDGFRFELVGAGMGQPNRVDSLKRLAAPRAREKNAAMGELLLVSDAFFPFADSVEAAFECGLRYIVQPGGSLRDSEVVQACDRHGIAMIFTGKRHFRH
ncbi:MAG: bifunctional phosphoribosylaminoimidazolecarboxamide formyltransferase/IMP cyclohydrolase [Pseudomonadota bacterium]